MHNAAFYYKIRVLNLDFGLYKCGKNADCVTQAKPMKQLGKLLNTEATSGLDALLQQARDMDDLAQKLRAGLGAPLAKELRAVNLREGGELIVVCSSSGWAARMRFETDTLLRLARQAGVQASGCRVRVSHD